MEPSDSKRDGSRDGSQSKSPPQVSLVVQGDKGMEHQRRPGGHGWGGARRGAGRKPGSARPRFREQIAAVLTEERRNG